MTVQKTLSKKLNQTAHLMMGMSAFKGWKRYGLAGLGGVAATLAMAPYYLLPLLVIGYGILASLLTSLLDGHGLDSEPRPLLRAFLTGWAFGFGYFISGLYWMGFAFLVRAEDFAWMIPIAIPAFAAFLGLFFALPSLLFVIVRKRLNIDGWQQGIALASFISFFEYLRGHILTGLPWNLTGQAMTGWIAGAQTVSFYGTYGLGLIILILTCSPAYLMRTNQRPLIGWAYCVAGFAIIYGIGAIMLAASPTRLNEDIVVSIVQPNISQKDKINPALVRQNFDTLINLSASGRAGRDAANPAQYLIWPENAVSWIDEQPGVLNLINDKIAPETIILTGSLRRSFENSGTQKFYNTMGILEADGKNRSVTGFYDKHHLVPFGEYLPLKGFLKAIGLSQLAPVEDGFTPGQGPQTYSIGPAPFSPLICYETIFPGAMHPRNARPEWLVTVTNDAWFGDDAGPKQHLDQARLRTIETGLPMVRAANTGISSVIDANGRTLARVNLYNQGVLDQALPTAKKAPLYSKLGDTLYFVMLFLSLGIAAFYRKTR